METFWFGLALYLTFGMGLLVGTVFESIYYCRLLRRHRDPPSVSAMLFSVALWPALVTIQLVAWLYEANWEDEP